MKRLLAFLLVLAMTLCLGGCAPEETSEPEHHDATALSGVDYGPHRAVGIFAVEEQMRDNAYWDQDETQANLSAAFYDAREDFFDYFYSLWGFGVSVNRSDNGRFPDKEVMHSVCGMLYYMEARESTEFTKAELIAASKRFYGQAIENFSGCEHCTYNKTSETLSWNSGCNTFPGNFMILRRLQVQEDGLCVAVFDRSSEAHYRGELDLTANFTSIRETLLNCVYDDLAEVETLTVTFRECKAEGYGTYLQILSMYPYTGLGSNTKK